MTALDHEQRRALIEDIMSRHAAGTASLGGSIRRLRLEVTGLDQDTFAAMCKMSTKALYQIETDKGNPTLNTVDAILRKFGLRLGLTAAPRIKAVVPLGAKAQVDKGRVRGTNPRRKAADSKAD